MTIDSERDPPRPRSIRPIRPLMRSYRPGRNIPAPSRRSGGVSVNLTASTAHMNTKETEETRIEQGTTQDILNKALEELKVLGDLQNEKHRIREEETLQNRQLCASLKQKETELDNVVCENAQKTQSLQRIKLQVAESAKLIHLVTQHSSHASDAIAELNRKIDFLNFIRASVDAYEAKITKRHTVCAQGYDEFEAKCKHFEESRTEIKNELATKTSSVNQLVATLNADSKEVQELECRETQLESDAKQLTVELEVLQEQDQDLVCEISMTETTINTNTVTLDELQQKTDTELAKVQAEIKEKQAVYEEKSKLLAEAHKTVDTEWEKVISRCQEKGIILTAEEHSKKNPPPRLLEDLHNSLRHEEQAVEEEEKNLAKLEAECKELQALLEEAEEEAVAARDEAEEACKDVQAFEADLKKRTEMARKQIEEEAALEKEVEALAEKYKTVKEDSKQRIEELHRDCKQIKISLNQLDLDIEQARSKADLASIEAEEAKRTYEEASKTFTAELEHIHTERDEVNESIEVAKSKLKEVIDRWGRLDDEEDPYKAEFERVYGEHYQVVPNNDIELAEERLMEMFRDFPELEFIEVKYDRKKDAERQAEKVLKELFDECDERLKSAEKLHAELLEKMKEDEIERKRISSAQEAESRRKKNFLKKSSKKSRPESPTARELLAQLDKAADSPSWKNPRSKIGTETEKKVRWGDSEPRSEIRPRSLSYPESSIRTSEKYKDTKISKSLDRSNKSGKPKSADHFESKAAFATSANEAASFKSDKHEKSDRSVSTFGKSGSRSYGSSKRPIQKDRTSSKGVKSSPAKISHKSIEQQTRDYSSKHHENELNGTFKRKEDKQPPGSHRHAFERKDEASTTHKQHQDGSKKNRSIDKKTERHKSKSSDAERDDRRHKSQKRSSSSLQEKERAHKKSRHGSKRDKLSRSSQSSGIATTENKNHRKRAKVSSNKSVSNGVASFSDDFGFHFQ